MIRTLKLLAAAAGALLALNVSAQQTYPERPIRLVLQFAAGGGSDAVARPLGQEMEKLLGQPIVIENKPGANGVIANQQVASASADGHTLLLAAAGPMTAAPHLYDLRLDPMKAFVPVALAVRTPYAIVAHSSVKVSSLKELLDLARRRPGQISYGTSGVGGAPHLAGEMLSSATGAKFLHVAYKGMGPAMNAVLSGEVDFAFADIAYAVPQLKTGRIKVLAVTGEQRSTAIPDVPTVQELDVANYHSGTWYGVFAREGTPPDVVLKVNEAVNKAMAGPLKERFQQQGMEPASNMNPEQFASFVKSDYERIGRVIKDAGIQVQQ